MPRKKAKDTIDHLESAECSEVLRELLARHKELRGEANEIAASLIEDVSVEEVAADVAELARSIDIDDVWARAGKQSWGYVEPSEAAWEMLEESLAGIQADMKRRVEAGMKPAAEKICQGIIIGLHEVDEINTDVVPDWAPDFPVEAAGWSLSSLLELYPKSQRRAAGNRVIRGVEENAASWIEMLERVVTKLASKKQTKRSQ